eukprot:scaffold12982_cov129-Cylindrotheca_fusiformis.AAC.2
MSSNSQTIISVANTMFAPNSIRPHKSLHSDEERLDAALALMGVSPSSVADSNGSLPLFDISESNCAKFESPAESSDSAPRRPRSNSAGLDALALLATKEQASMEHVPQQMDLAVESRPLVASAISSSSSDDDSEAMPPPPPRLVTSRRRSVSNPEGMEKWAPRDQNRLHFVLPASILEEELAEASAAMKAKEEEEKDDSRIDSIVNENEGILEPDELLRRARSRLLEDLSESNLNGEKGVLMLPHSLAKYKEVYNKNGRIGIYTPAERAAIISRFQGKRSRRVWNKKIRYNCRKNLADRRMRVKGRFVKRSTEQQARSHSTSNAVSTIPESEEANFLCPRSFEDGEQVSVDDLEMPDVSDLDAGFCPTDDQPFRRTRRHTIT